MGYFFVRLKYKHYLCSRIMIQTANKYIEIIGATCTTAMQENKKLSATPFVLYLFNTESLHNSQKIYTHTNRQSDVISYARVTTIHKGIITKFLCTFCVLILSRIRTQILTSSLIKTINDYEKRIKQASLYEAHHQGL